jgi:cytoskeleton protein RodZ
MERNEVLNLYLCDLRRAARLSVEQVCVRTKIQPRFVDAIEAGHWAELPSNTHLRAFSLAMAKACGGDEAHAAALVRRLLSVTAPVPALETGGRGFDTPAPAPTLAMEPMNSAAFQAPQPAFASAGQGPALGAALGSSSLAAASDRLRSLPLSVLLTLLALAGTLSYGAAWSVEHWRQREISQELGSQTADAPPTAGSPAPAASAVAAARDGGAPAASAPAAQSAAGPASGASAAMVDLSLRARRACWLVLDIDGKRLPTITMQDGDKFNWSVSRRAVLLAGNLGALRVWWQGDNLGYLGDLDQRANAMVFERGRAPHLDPSAALDLPVGIPQ